MTNGGAVKSRDKLPDRLRLHIVEMARRSDGILVEETPAISKMNGSQTPNTKDTSRRINYSTFPIVSQKRDRIDLGLRTGNGNEGKSIAPGQSVSNDMSESGTTRKSDNTRDGKTEIDDIRRQRSQKYPKPFIYDDVKNSLPNYSNHVPVYHVTDFRAANSIASSMKPVVRSTPNFHCDYFKSTHPKGNDSFRRQTAIENCEVKGNACLTPRNQNSFILSQSNQRAGLFSASLLAIKRRRNGPISSAKRRPFFKEACDCAEDYVIRAEQTEKPAPVESNDALKTTSPRESRSSFSPRHIQSSTTTNLKPAAHELSSSRAAQMRIAPRTKNTPSPFNRKFDSKGYSPSFDDQSVSSDEPFRCSYRLPEDHRFNTALSLANGHELKTDQQVADVKTYVLENNSSARIKPDLAPLTARNLQVHDSIINKTNQMTTNKSTPQRFSSGSFNITANSNGLSYQSDYLDPSENERISTWLSAINAETVTSDLTPTNPDNTSKDLVQCLQSCHGAHGSAMAFVTHSIIHV